MSKYGGAFTWESLLCRFFLDIDPFAPQVKRQPNEALAVLAALGADDWQDMCTVDVLPDQCDPDVAMTLFHEQVHYWQLISSPFLQSLFITALQKMRLVVAANKGNPSAICGDAGLDDAPDMVTRSLEYCYALMHGVNGEPQGIITTELGTSPPAAVTRFGVAMDDSDFAFPGYLGSLSYPDRAEDRHVNVDLLSLTESHAYISEQMYGRLPVRGLAANEPAIAASYKGLWELWRRYFADGENGAAMLDSFLVAVDLALAGGQPYRLMQFHELQDFPVERFKRLFVVAKRMPLLDVAAGGNVAAYQQRLEGAANLAPQSQLLPSAKRRLLRMLTFSLGPQLGVKSEQWKQWLDALVNGAECKCEPDILAAVIEVFKVEQNLPFGAQVLATMYNALDLRERRPELFIHPSRWSEELAEHFPLPLVILQGKYCAPRPKLSSGIPIPVRHGMLRHDIVALAAIRPTVLASSNCGFLESGMDCWFTAQGLGCPRNPGMMDSRAKDIRGRTQLITWCHRTRAELILGLATPFETEYWTGRLASKSSGRIS